MRQDVAEVDLQPRMDALAARVREETQIPGIVLGASVDGQRTYAAAGTSIAGERRRLGKSATFALGCASKLPLAIRAHELARRGAMDLRNPSPRTCPSSTTSRAERPSSASTCSLTPAAIAARASSTAACAHSLGRLGGVFEVGAAAVQPGTVFSYEHTESVLLVEIVRRVGGAAPYVGHAGA